MRSANNNYDDIIDHKHHVSNSHPHMTREDRAAQFAPFAALNGYDETISNAEKLHETGIEIPEELIGMEFPA